MVSNKEMVPEDEKDMIIIYHIVSERTAHHRTAEKDPPHRGGRQLTVIAVESDTNIFLSVAFVVQAN